MNRCSKESESRTTTTARSLDFHVREENNVSLSESSGEINNPDGGGCASADGVKGLLRKKLQDKLSSTNSKETDILGKWHRELSVAGFSGEILNLSKKHSPLHEIEPLAHFPERVLVLYPSNVYSYAEQTGPFQPVRLIVHGDGKWSLQCPIYEHMILKSGTLDTLESSCLVQVAKDLMCGNQSLCTGIVEDVEFSEFGYVPKGIRVMSGPMKTTHAVSCMIWHVPSSRQNASGRSKPADPRWRRMCTECLKVTRYLKRRVKAKKSVDVAAKALRQMPSSHCPWKYLSPNSKSKRSRNVRQQRTRLQKQVLKFYKKTKVELPARQSSELCKLVKAIGSSEEGKRQLDEIRKEGNKLEVQNGSRAGDCVSEVWIKDRESFFEDQQNNGEDYSCFGLYF